MDFSYNSDSNIYVLVACHNDDAPDLVAIGGDHSVEVLLVGPSSCESLALFHIGTRLTAMAWSPRSVSPSASEEWVIELAVAGADYGLRLLTKTVSQPEDVFHFGGGLSGHHGKVNDITFCGGMSAESSRYVATVSDDKMLMVWDLTPHDTDVRDEIGSPDSRPQPTVYVIAYPHPLTSIDSHTSTTKELLVSDCRGTVYIVDWRSDPGATEQDSWRSSSVLELTDPHALSEVSVGLSLKLSGSVAWRRDSPDIIGSVYGSKFSLWDLSNLQGGKPYATSSSFTQGGHRFRWCPTYPEYFAISTQSPLKGAIVHVYSTNYVYAQPTVFNVSPRPQYVRDFDFLATRGIPRLAVAVGRSVVIFPIGVES
ncbi:WD40-repeat-containing domain protein [Lentinula aff. detonsa]|uniref:WD40-repeat-containing domain protein n=1 Tax=Lentinula aff. detonsa TaxID=2804958 RepID=A0AA38NE72_9AGAR|nr:WD40-repeat-containing domain protein [Lentinula aff. detonsa]